MIDTTKASRPAIPIWQRLIWGILIPIGLFVSIAVIAFISHFHHTGNFHPHQHAEVLATLVKATAVGIFGFICAPFVLLMNASLALLPWTRRIGSLAAGVAGILLGVGSGVLTTALILWLSR